MGGVVGRVEVDAVPAGGEADVGHDAFFTGAGGHGRGFAGAREERVEAGEGQLPEAGGFCGGAVLDDIKCQVYS